MIDLNKLTAKGRHAVDFYADWCGPCKVLKPLLEQACEEEEVCLHVVNVDEERELSSKMGVRGLPTVVLFENGEEIGRFTGSRSIDFIKPFLRIALFLLLPFITFGQTYQEGICLYYDKGPHLESCTTYSIGDSISSFKVVRQQLINDVDGGHYFITLDKEYSSDRLSQFWPVKEFIKPKETKRL